MKVICKLNMDDLEGAVEEARRLEDLGYDGVAAEELKHDALLRLLVAAGATTRLTLESRVAIAFPRSPMAMAYAAWDLQRYSQGRFKLGLGTQVKAHITRRFSVPWSAPGPRLREYVLALYAIWRAWQERTPLDFHGGSYSLTLMTPAFDPGPIPYPPPPVYLAAVNPYNFRLAGAIADGAVVATLNSAEYIRQVVRPKVAEGARRAGRDPGAVRISGGGFVVTGARRADLEEGKREAKWRIAFYASPRSYQTILAVHGWEELTPRLHALTMEGKWEEMTRLVSDEMLHTFAVVGLYDEIAPMVKERFDGLVDELCPHLYAHPPMDVAQERKFVEALKS